jgi:OFA family oxalate/formate antiporter-like MFS transporter
MGGFAYAWGVFIVPIVARFGWTTAEAALPFTVFMLVFALTVFPAGRLQDIIGPRKVSAIGAILFLAAYGLAALVGRFAYPWWLAVTYGAIGGGAFGLTYSCVAPAARKWFPDRPALAIAVAMTGLGLAAVVLAPLKADHLIPTYGIEGTLFIMGIVTSAGSLFAAWLIRNPPAGWKPPEGRLKKGALPVKTIGYEASPRDLIRSPIFYLMWLAFGLVCAGSLMSIPLIPAFGELVVGLTAVEAAGAIAVFAVFNGFSRPVAGFLSDRFGLVRVLIVTYVIQATALLSFPVFAVTLHTLYIAAALLGWGLAVTGALFPALTASFFGVKHLGANYGMVFSSFGVAAFAPAAGAAVYDITRSFAPAFISAGILAVVAVIVCAILRRKYAL